MNVCGLNHFLKKKVHKKKGALGGEGAVAFASAYFAFVPNLPPEVGGANHGQRGD